MPFFGVVQEWNAGTVTAIGAGLSLASQTLAATGGGGGPVPINLRVPLGTATALQDCVIPQNAGTIQTGVNCSIQAITAPSATGSIVAIVFNNGVPFAQGTIPSGQNVGTIVPYGPPPYGWGGNSRVFIGLSVNDTSAADIGVRILPD